MHGLAVPALCSLGWWTSTAKLHGSAVRDQWSLGHVLWIVLTYFIVTSWTKSQCNNVVRVVEDLNRVGRSPDDDHGHDRQVVYPVAVRHYVHRAVLNEN